MHEFRLLTAALAATTLFVGGLAYATDHAHLPVATNGASQQQAMIGGNAHGMSSGVRLAFTDVRGL